MRISIKKIIGLFLLIIVLMSIGAVACLWIMFPPERIKALVIPEIEKALSRNVTVNKAEYSIYPTLGVSLTGVKLSNSTRSGFSNESFVTLDHFLIQISISSIFKGHLEISKIVLQKPNILIEENSSGALNFDDMAVIKNDSIKKEKERVSFPALPVPITLKSLEIEHGSVTYIDKKSNHQLIVGDIRQSIKLDIDKNLKDVKTSGTLILSQISLKTGQKKKPLSNVTLTLNHSINADLSQGKIMISQLQLSFKKVFLNLSGTVSNLNDKPEMDLALNADPIKIQDLLTEIPVEFAPAIAKLTASGVAETELKIKGTLKEDGTIPITGKLKLRDVSIKYRSLPKSINKLNADINFTDSSAAINSMHLNFGDNPIQLHASIINFKHPFVDLAIQAKLKLQDTRDIIELPAGASLSGMANINVHAMGRVIPADPAKLDVKGAVDLKDISMQWPPLTKPALVNGHFLLSSKAIGQNLSVNIGRSSLIMNATISNYLSLIATDLKYQNPKPVIKFTITSPLVNADEFLPPKKSKAPDDQDTVKKGQSDSPLIASLPGIEMHGTLNAKKIIYQGVEMNNTRVGITNVNDIADITLNTGFADGSIDGTFHVDLRNTANIIFINKLNINDIELNDILGKFGDFVKPTIALNRDLVNLQHNIFGKVTIKSNLSGHGGTQDAITRSLYGDITVKIGNGKLVNSKILHSISGVVAKFVKLNDLDFHDFNAVMHVENEQVNFNSFQIFSNYGDWDIFGNVGFDTELNMNITNRLPKETSGQLLAVQNGGKSLANNLLKNSRFAAMATSLVDKAGIPSDNDGRVTLKMSLSGTTSNPKASFKGFGKFGTNNSSDSTSRAAPPKKGITTKLKDSLSQTKEQVESKFQEGKSTFESQIRHKEEHLKNGVNKLKKLFK